MQITIASNAHLFRRHDSNGSMCDSGGTDFANICFGSPLGHLSRAPDLAHLTDYIGLL